MKGYCRDNTAARGFAIGTITYPGANGSEARSGSIYYIKSTLCDGLRDNLYSYHATLAAFPDEPTSDQFFDEQQFEVYRMLGEDIADQMIGYLQDRYTDELRPYPFTEASPSWER